MNTLLHGLVLIGVLAVSSPTQAGEVTDARPNAWAERVAPFLDEQTIVVARIDLTKIDIDSLVNQLVQYLPEVQGRVEPFAAPLRRAVDVFRKAGVEELYFVVSLADVPVRPPLIVLPLGPNADATALRAGLVRIQADWPLWRRDVDLRTVGSSVVVGSDQAFRRIESRRPDPRPRLGDAFRAVVESDVQVLLLPTDNDRRVIEELLPELPKEIGGGPSTILTRGVRWAAAGLKLDAPRIQGGLTVQSLEPEDAKRLADRWNAGLTLLAKGGNALRLELNDKEIDSLRFQVKKSQVHLWLNPIGAPGAASGPELLVRGVRAPLREAVLAAWRMQTFDNIKQIGLAMHNYHDRHKSFPAQASYTNDGKPLLSWRVHLLPHLDEGELYRQFRLDESWDSPHNRKLIERMPAVYRSPASRAEKGQTVFLRPIGPNTICPGRQAIGIRDITDGTSNTILLVEADDAQAVVWTKPDDLPFSPKDPARGLGGLYPGGFNTGLADGSVLSVKLPMKPKRLAAFFTRNGGEVSDFHGD